MSEGKVIQEFSGGEVLLWIEQGNTIHIKTVEPHGDPVELTEVDAEELAAALLKAVKVINGET
jgi:hypothetical protein